MLATGAGVSSVGDGVLGTGSGVSVVVTIGARVSVTGDGVLGTGVGLFSVWSQGGIPYLFNIPNTLVPVDQVGGHVVSI